MKLLEIVRKAHKAIVFFMLGLVLTIAYKYISNYNAKYDYSNPQNVLAQVATCERNGLTLIRLSKSYNGTVTNIYCVDQWDNNYDSKDLK